MKDFENMDRYLAQSAEDEETQEFFAPSHMPHLIDRKQTAQSGVSELGERLRRLYLEGTEEDAP